MIMKIWSMCSFCIFVESIKNGWLDRHIFFFIIMALSSYIHCVFSKKCNEKKSYMKLLCDQKVISVYWIKMVGVLCGVVANVLDWNIIVRFELEFHYWIHFSINTFGKCMNRLIPHSHGLNSIPTVIQKCLWH